MPLRAQATVRVPLGGPILTVGRTIFEMWLGLGGSPGLLLHNYGRMAWAAANVARAYAAATSLSQGIDLLFRDCLEEIDLESGPCL